MRALVRHGAFKYVPNREGRQHATPKPSGHAVMVSLRHTLWFHAPAQAVDSAGQADQARR